MSVVAQITNPQIRRISLIKRTRQATSISKMGALQVIDDRCVQFCLVLSVELWNLRMSRGSPGNAMQNDPRGSCSLFLVCSPWRSQFSSEVAQLSLYNRALRAHRGARDLIEFSI